MNIDLEIEKLHQETDSTKSEQTDEIRLLYDAMAALADDAQIKILEIEMQLIKANCRVAELEFELALAEQREIEAKAVAFDWMVENGKL